MRPAIAERLDNPDLEQLGNGEDEEEVSVSEFSVAAKAGVALSSYADHGARRGLALWHPMVS